MTKHLLLGRLRRDTMILGASENTDDLKTQGEDAVKQGRAAEVFIIECVGYFSESDQNWGGIDRYQGGTYDTAPASVPPLNPGAGEQEPEGTSDEPTVSIAGNIEAAAEEQRKSGDLVDAGEADRLATMARGGAAPAAGGNEALAKEAQKPSVNPDDKPASDAAKEPAKTASLDAGTSDKK